MLPFSFLGNTNPRPGSEVSKVWTKRAGRPPAGCEVGSPNKTATSPSSSPSPTRAPSMADQPPGLNGWQKRLGASMDSSQSSPLAAVQPDPGQSPERIGQLNSPRLPGVPVIRTCMPVLKRRPKLKNHTPHLADMGLFSRS